MRYRTEIRKREYDGKFLVWKEVPYGEIIGASDEDIDYIPALQSPEWVIASIHDTRGQAYRSTRPNKEYRNQGGNNNPDSTKKRRTSK